MTDYRFGVGSRVYTFPTPMQAIDDNFNNVVPQTTRLPGLSGGFDNFGTDPAPAEIGKVTLSFTLRLDWAMHTYSESDPAIAMQMARDAVNAMQHWGKTKLFKPAGDTTRFCYARINNIDMPYNENRNSSIWQPVSINFQCSDPHWYELGTEQPEWGEFDWDSGVPWGGSSSPQVCSGTSTTWTITTNGNAPTKARIQLIGLTGGMQNPTLQRIVDAQVVDEVSYTGSLLEDDDLQINCRAKRVTLNSADAYNNNFEYETPDWFTLDPGANTIRLLMGNVGNQAQVYVRYYEAYT